MLSDEVGVFYLSKYFINVKYEKPKKSETKIVENYLMKTT